MTTAANFSRDDSGNITIKQGTSISWAYTLQDALSAPLDTTGYTARMHIRSTFDSKNILLALTTENGKIQNDNAGTFTNFIEPVDTSYGAGTGIKVLGESLEAVYDYEVVSPTGEVTRIDEGTCTIDREVTREL